MIYGFVESLSESFKGIVDAHFSDFQFWMVLENRHFSVI